MDDMKILAVSDGRPQIDIPEEPQYMTREEAIQTMHDIHDYYMDDCIYNSGYGFDEDRSIAVQMAIADMKRVAELEAENKRLKEGIAKAKAKVERKCIGGQWSEAVIYGMRKAVGIFDEYLGEVEHENEK